MGLWEIQTFRPKKKTHWSTAWQGQIENVGKHSGSIVSPKTALTFGFLGGKLRSSLVIAYPVVSVWDRFWT